MLRLGHSFPPTVILVPSMRFRHLPLTLSLFLTAFALTGSVRPAAGDPPGVEASVAQSLRTEQFPRPAAIEPQVQFWIKVYSEYTTSQMALHDSEALDIIYTVVDLPPGQDPAMQRVRRDLLRATRERYESALKCLASAESEAELDELAVEVKEIWGDRGSPGVYDAAATRLRFQLGQADRFRAGVARSGRYMPRMRRIAAEVEAPIELLALPHVESSFDPSALSHRSASGIWQWTRGTGRHYMRIDRKVDERRDPLLATRASLRCLSEYHDELGSWPLAITAYNHGIEGMRRARDEVGTDIARVIAEYEGPAFRFASRNFYAEFLAALQVSENYSAYFGPVDFDVPLEMDAVPLKRTLPWAQATKHAGIPAAELARDEPRPARTRDPGQAPDPGRLRAAGYRPAAARSCSPTWIRPRAAPVPTPCSSTAASTRCAGATRSPTSRAASAPKWTPCSRSTTSRTTASIPARC